MYIPATEQHIATFAGERAASIRAEAAAREERLARLQAQARILELEDALRQLRNRLRKPAGLAGGSSRVVCGTRVCCGGHVIGSASKRNARGQPNGCPLHIRLTRILPLRRGYWDADGAAAGAATTGPRTGVVARFQAEPSA